LEVTFLPLRSTFS